MFGSVERKELLDTTGRNIQLLWRVAWQFLVKLNISGPYDTAIPFLGIYLRKIHISIGDTCKNFNHSPVCYVVGGMEFVGGIGGNLVFIIQVTAK